MAWEISISADGWQAIRDELDKWPCDKLINAITDDVYERVDQASGSMEHAMAAAQAEQGRLIALPQDILADRCYELIEEHSTCENGGNGYWIDREGYHRVYTGD